MKRTLVLCCALTVATSAQRALSQSVPTYRTGTPAFVIPIGGMPLSSSNGVSDVRRLPNGQIVATFCAAGEVHAYDLKGQPLWTQGKGNMMTGIPVSGELPEGMYTMLRRAFPAGGDTVAVVDGLGTSRVQLIVGGKVARTILIPGALNQSVDVIGRLRDGSFVGRRRGPMPTDVGIQRPPITILRLTPAGVPLDSITVPGGEVGVVPSGPARTQPLRLGRGTVIGVLGDGVVVGTQDQASFDVYDVSLRNPKKVATITTPEATTDKTSEAWIANRAELTPMGGVLPVYHANFPDQLPAYREIAPSADGRVWLQDPIRAAQFPLVWTAYRDGKAVARVELPPRFHPSEFGADWVLGVAADDNAVGAIQQLPLVAGALSGATPTPRAAQPPNPPRCGPWMAR